ncbi:MAG: bifunctional acetate--CoA ligase family protein/GNAT family N-acetyltransferase [Syntrophales bacterium]|jgi:acetyltransferase
MLTSLFEPHTIAILNPPETEDLSCRNILGNLASPSDRKVFAIGVRKKTACGLPRYASLSDVPEPVELAIVSKPSDNLPGIVEDCGKKGVKSVLIMYTSLRAFNQRQDIHKNQILEIRKQYGFRILGPDSIGFIRPHTGLNATSLAEVPEKGEIALITQGGSFGKTIFNWGISSHVGFSMFASLGAAWDIGLGDLIDFLGNDPFTKSIMIYMEDQIGDVKKFMSAARGFSRSKPIVFLKPPVLDEGVPTALSHAGFLAGTEDVFDAVLRRAGVVRVKEAKDLFNAGSVLYAKQLPKGNRLAIITNASGAGNMATNRLLRSGGQLTKLSADTVEAIEGVLQCGHCAGNPIDVSRDADENRYAEIIRLCIEDPGVDGILVIYTSQDGALSDSLATAILPLIKGAGKPVLTTWIGGKDVRNGRDTLNQNGVPSYDTPEEAVRTYLYMYNHERNLQILYETPSELPVDEAPPKNNLKALIKASCRNAVPILTEDEARKFLVSYGIPTIKTATAKSIESAIFHAEEIGYPVVLKIISPQIIFRPDVGGIVTGIKSVEALRGAYNDILERAHKFAPDAVIRGVTVQKMIEVVDYELILGARKDRNFGSVILFGMGGVGVRIFQDFSIGLPPLNQSLARRLIEDTKVFRMLQGYRGKPPMEIRQLEQIIVGFSHLIVDFPEILEMDINPIAVSNGQAYALGARIIPDKDCSSFAGPYPHLIITPYPSRYIMNWRMSEGSDVLLRPIRPEDEPLEHEMFTTLTQESLRGRYFQAIKNITHMMHARSCNIDYDREMTIVAEIKENGKRRIAGIGSFVIEPGTDKCEFAILVHDDFQGKGLAYKLIDILIGIAGERGLKEFYGYIEQRNLRMIRLCEKLGMVKNWASEGLYRVSLSLN